ncbi:uncharacterized protein V1516DRAFT_116089 [Lipomyces oligophaga]|uniref:uncharacterized protein n=1 Tax=Lipomyces oligophaga TaxID=45792 RepID=UPI0034CE88DF
MSIQFDDFEVILTEADKEALNGEDVNVLNIPKDWPELSDVPSTFSSWTLASRNEQYLDCVATRQSIFDDPVKSEALGLNSLYNELPSFDVQARWSLREEHLLMRKVNFKVFFISLFSLFSFCLGFKGQPPLAISYLCTDLDISKKVFIVILVTMSFLFYAILILSSFLLKKASFSQLPSASLFAAGLALVAQYWITNIAELFVTQAIIALGSSSAYIFSTSSVRSFYTGQDLKFIAFLFLPAFLFIDLVFSLTGYSVISLGKAGDPARWRDASLVYGILSCFIAIASLHIFPPSPLTASSYKILLKRFTLRELTIMVNRVLRDNPFLDSSQTRLMKPKFNKAAAKSVFFSLHALLCCLVSFVLVVVLEMSSEAFREHILKQDRLSANLSGNS